MALASWSSELADTLRVIASAPKIKGLILGNNWVDALTMKRPRKLDRSPCKSFYKALVKQDISNMISSYNVAFSIKTSPEYEKIRITDYARERLAMLVITRSMNLLKAQQ